MAGASSPVSIVSASYTTPIAVTTATQHGLQTGMQVTISGVEGNTAANGTFSISVTSLTAFNLVGVAGTGTGTGGTVTGDILITTAAPHGLQTGMQVTISGVQGNTAANGVFIVTVTSPTTFFLNGVAGNAPWKGGGSVTADIIVAAVTDASPIAITTHIPARVADWVGGYGQCCRGQYERQWRVRDHRNEPHGVHSERLGGNGVGTSGGNVTVSKALTIQTIVIQALAAATDVTSNVVTPVLLGTGALPLDAATIALLAHRPKASIRPSSRPSSMRSRWWPKPQRCSRH